MTDRDTNWLTLQEAATVVGCSVKTLYRRMNQGQLGYTRDADGRRYIAESSLCEQFLASTRPTKPGYGPTTEELIGRLEELESRVNAQAELLEELIRLYAPQSLADVAWKHSAARKDDHRY